MERLADMAETTSLASHNLRVKSIEIDLYLLEFLQDLASKGEWTMSANIMEVNLGREFLELEKQPSRLDSFMTHVENSIKEVLKEDIYEIVMINFAMFTKDLITDLRQDIDPSLDSLTFTIKHAAIYDETGQILLVDNGLSYPPVRTLFDDPIKSQELLETSYHLTASNFFVHLQHVYAEHLGNVTRYQCYDEIGMSCKNSKSKEKYEAAHVPNVGGKRILDIGCNTGYFPNHYAVMDPPPREVVGIDFVEENLQLAQCFSTMIMGTREITSYREVDFLQLSDEPENSFDMISCTSAFHYFQDQRAFLDKVQSLLTDRGLLLLEVGLSRDNPGRPYTQKQARLAREVGNEPVFPNLEQLKVLSSAYKLVHWGASVNQPGDPLPRMFFHFSLDPNAQAVDFPLHSDLP